MRILFFLLISVASFGQVPLWQLEYAPDSTKVIGAKADGEPVWVNTINSIFTENDSTFYVSGGDTIFIGTNTKIDSLVYTDSLRLYTSDGIFTTYIASGSQDSTVIIGDYGVTAVETSPNTWTLKADTSEVATPFDLTLKENVLTFTSPLTRSVNTVSIPAATTSVSGHLTSTDWNTFNGKVGGSGSSNKVAYWTGTNTQSFNNNFHWDNVNGRLGIGTAAPGNLLGLYSGATTQTIEFNRIGGWHQSEITNYFDSFTNKGLRLGGNATYGQTTMPNVLTINNYNNNNGGRLGIEVDDPLSRLHLNVPYFVNSNDGIRMENGATSVIQQINNDGDLIFRTTSGNMTIAPQTSTIQAVNPSASLHLFGSTGVGSTSFIKVERPSWNEAFNITQQYTDFENQGTQFSDNDFTFMNFNTFRNRIGVNLPASVPSRTLDINGEVRIRDLTTTTPTRLVSADADGVISSLGLSGLSITGGNLTVTATTRDSTIVTGGTGISVNESPLNTFTVTNTGDLSSTNEGVLGVGIGTGSSSIITSNTSGSPSVTLQAGSGIGISESGTTITIENTAPAQEVTIDGFGISVVGGSYPDFTITSTEVDGVIGNEYNTSMSAGFIGILPALSITDGGGTLNGSIPLFSTNSSNAAGVVPGSDGSTSKFLNASGIWMAETGDISAVTVSAPITGGGTSGSVNIGIDTTSSTGVATQYDLTQIDQDQVVSLIGGGITSITGTYPNFTVTSTEVDGSITNEIQDLSLSGNTLSLTGDATTVDLSSFAGNGTVTSVGIVNGGGITVSGSPITTSGNITITAADQSASNEYNTSVTSTYVGNLPAITITDGGGAKTGVVQVFSSNFSNYGSVPGANGATTSFLRGDGVWAMPTLSEVDGDFTNEGRLGVGSGTSTTSVILSNTSGANGVTITAGTGLSIAETTNANGGNITLTNTSLDTDDQTLSFTSPNLSISGGNSVTLPVLPAGVSTQTLAYIGGAWSASSFLKTNSTTTATGTGKRVDINNDGGGETWPSSVNTSTKFLVNGRVQMNSTSSTNATTIMGRNTDSEVGTITVGSGLRVSSGSLTANHYGQLRRTSILASATLDNSYRRVDFQAADDTDPLVVDANLSTHRLKSVVDGTYEITYSLTYFVGSLRDVLFHVYNNTTDLGYNAQTKSTAQVSGYTTISRTFIATLAAGADLEIKYTSPGTATTISIENAVFTMKKIN